MPIAPTDSQGRLYPILEEYFAIGSGTGQAVARHVVHCLAYGYIHHQDLADWLEGYHYGGNRELLEQYPVRRRAS